MKPLNNASVACFLFVSLVSVAVLAADGAIDLIEPGKPSGGWEFQNGAEFPGATGTLALAEGGENALLLHGDFTKGGNYVSASRKLPPVGFERLYFRMKAPGINVVTMRLVDGTGQCHQIKVKVAAKDDWQTVDFPVLEFFRNMGTSASIPNIAQYEKWGGANDGKWHSPCKLIAFLIGKTSTTQIVDLSLSDARIYPNEGVMFREGFDGAGLPAGWNVQGDVSLDATGAFKGEKALKLTRAADKLEQQTSITGSSFSAAPGPWRIAGAAKSDLNSPDNSYNGVVSVQALSGSGAVLESFPITEVFKKTEWKPFDKRIEFPQYTATARLHVVMNKADGSVWVDEVTATRLNAVVQKRIERIEITTERLGNLLLPEDKPEAKVKVVALRALKEKELNLLWTVRDYWGAEQCVPETVTLNETGKAKNSVTYEATLDLSAANMELGRYYEIHVELPRPLEPEREISGIARLPLALTKKYTAEEVPFTIRNWDNRVKEYFHLSDRLGIRSIGIWGGWESKAPHKPQAPGLETLKELNAKWVTTTPAANIERNGFKEYSEEALRIGTQNFLKQYAGPDLHFICLGNEPHGKIDKVKNNVKAYRAIYEEVKKFDPKIFVVGTSVEPNEDYFSEGYYQYLDAYDFHIYESYKDVRRTMREYRALMEKYKAVKPIYSTELGLNSQGMTRHTVAIELVKKVTSFFAEGGSIVSWFTIQYPDPQGKARGTSGDAHCVFDCKYSKYNPRLDAIMYYTMVNGIAIKKFNAEKAYPDGTQAYLFKDKDDNCLVVLWNETARRDVALPLNGVAGVDLVRVDGGRVTLAPDAAGVTVGVSTEPVLLFFTQKDAKLPDALATPAFALATEPMPGTRGKSSVIALKGAGLTAQSLRVTAPPQWKVEVGAGNAEGLEFSVAVPDTTAARGARVTIQKLTGDKVSSEITLTVPIAEGK